MAISSYEEMTGRSAPAGVKSAAQSKPSIPDQGSAYTAVTGRELPTGVTSVSQNQPGQYVVGIGDGGIASIVPPQKTTTRRIPRYDNKGKLIGYDVQVVDEFGNIVSSSFEASADNKSSLTKNVAYDTIEKILESYRITGLASVLETIRDEYPEASSEDILTLLQFDSRYNAKFNERFAANADRLKAGKPVLSPSEYLKLEQGYMKVFNAYNLPTFNTQSYYDSFIKGDVDIEEVTDRVQLGYDRVLNDKAVQDAFNKFYSALGFSDIVAGMLDTTNQLPALERKVKAAEIGGAALRQGLVASELAATEAQANVGYTNVSRGTLGADVLGRQGVTKAQAEEGYKKIAQVLPTAEKLSSIYGGTEEQYGRLEAEQEQLQGLASAARKKQRLIELETAQFKKSSGLSKSALKSTTNI